MKQINIDPRTKLAIVALLSTLGLIYKDLLSLVFILSVAILIALALNSNFISVVSRLKKLLGLILVIAIIQSIFIKEGNSVISPGSLSLLTDIGIMKATEFILRLMIIIVSSVILTTTTSREIIQALIQMGLPYEIAFMVSISIRFLPLFKDEMRDMVVALQLRGIDLKKIKLKEKLLTYKYLLLPITANSILRARELATAMEMKAFRAHPKRTSYKILKMNKIDYLIITISLIGAWTFIIIF